MRERVEMVGGHLSIDSAAGQGTTVDVEMANRPVTPLGN
jgi:signal transduction histidine kinase